MSNPRSVVQVIFLPEGGSDPIVPPWVEGESLHAQGGYVFQVDNWEACVLNLTNRAAQEYVISAAPFLCLLGDHLINHYNYHLLERLVEEARKHGWGAPVYLVVDKSIDISESQIENRAALSDWFDKVIKAGASELLEVKFDRSYGFIRSDMNPLTSNAKHAEKRNCALQQAAGAGEWKWGYWGAGPVSVKDGTCLTTFIPDYVIQPTDQAFAGNLLLVIDMLHDLEQVRFVKETLKKYTRCHPVVALYKVPASDKLKSWCRQSKLPLIEWEFRGPYELRFFLERANRDAHPSGTSLSGGDVRAVRVENQVFPLPDSSLRTALLITNSFHPIDFVDARLCIAASQEAGQITYHMPICTHYNVHPALNGDHLPDVLEKMSEKLSLMAWVYLGHGRKVAGQEDIELQEFSKNFHAAAQWLLRFQSYERSLALAFFSACESAQAARLFAQAGVGVAIGFEGQVIPPASMLLAQEVVSAALRSGGNRERILEAFHRGCTRLQARGYSQSQPVAYWSDCGK